MTGSVVNRFEGRLFLEHGRLYMVVEADEIGGMGRVSVSIDGERQLLDMPISEIAQRLAKSAKLTLDSIGDATAGRVQKKSDGWFFSAREGLKGPFDSQQDAQEALDSYIMLSQDAA